MRRRFVERRDAARRAHDERLRQARLARARPRARAGSRATTGPRYASAAVVDARSYSRNSGATSCDATTCASGMPPPQLVGDRALVRRVAEREEQADRDRLGVRRPAASSRSSGSSSPSGPIRPRTPWQRSSGTSGSGCGCARAGRGARASAGAGGGGARSRRCRRTRCARPSARAARSSRPSSRARSARRSSAPTARAAASTDSSCRAAVGTFAVRTRPPSRSTASVNVPPTSTPRIATLRTLHHRGRSAPPLRLRRPDRRHRDAFARRLGAALPRARPRAAAGEVGARSSGRSARRWTRSAISRSSSGRRSSASRRDRRAAARASTSSTDARSCGPAWRTTSPRPSGAGCSARSSRSATRVDRHAISRRLGHLEAGTRSSPPNGDTAAREAAPRSLPRGARAARRRRGRGDRLRGLAERRHAPRRPRGSSASRCRTRSRATLGLDEADLVLDSLADVPLAELLERFERPG